MSSLTSDPFSRELIMGSSTNEFGALGIHSPLYSVKAAKSAMLQPFGGTFPIHPRQSQGSWAVWLTEVILQADPQGSATSVRH